MAIYHCYIKIISRAGGRSAVASAAYRSGEKLYNDETGLLHDFTHKCGVIMNEIILPENAPERYHDRQILWNEVQKIEKRSDAQFAREVEVALPVEMDREDQIRCIRDFINENFVSEGMIADWALHDKGDGNPHTHIMLTMRGFDEHEKWLQKQRSVFANARDEKGRAVYDPSLPVYDPKNREETSVFRIPQLDKDGNQKVRIRKGKGTEYLWEKISIPANDWNDRSKAEVRRASWAEHCNRYLDKDHQIDHRSYERQGIDKKPTIHEGVTARQMEVDGKVSDRCQQNRDIRERNSLIEEMKAVAQELTKIITEKAREIFGRFKKLRGDFGDTKSTGRDAEYLRSPAGRDRDAAIREAESSRTTGRIHELKRTVDRTASEIDKTDYEIAITDQRITELREIAQRKEAIIASDAILFGGYLEKAIVGLYESAVKAGSFIAQIADYLPWIIVSGVMHRVLSVFTVVVILGGAGLLVFLVTRAYLRFFKDKQADEITAGAVLMDTAVTVYMARERKQLLSVNLVLMFLLIVAAYSVIRAVIQIEDAGVRNTVVRSALIAGRSFAGLALMVHFFGAIGVISIPIGLLLSAKRN